MKRTFIVLGIVALVACIYFLVNRKQAPISSGDTLGGATLNTAGDTTGNSVAVRVNESSFTSQLNAGFPIVEASINDISVTARFILPSDQTGKITGDPNVVVELPTGISYPSDLTIVLRSLSPETPSITTTVTLTRKNQPAITDADWTPTAN